jgi:hypothetical protein
MLLTFKIANFRRDFHAAFFCKLNGRDVMGREGDCPYLRTEFFRP